MLGYWNTFDYVEVAKIAAIGGVIGVLFTVPLRRALIVTAKLKYPEGVATAEVLRAGDKAKKGTSDDGSGGLKTIGIASLVGGIMKVCQQGFAMWHAEMAGAITFGKSIFGLGTDLSPALISVGYIVGRNIGILVVGGGLISWAVAIPIYSALVGFEGNALDSAWDIWNSKIRYLGVGAMVVGGVWSLIKLFKPLVEGVKASLDSVKNQKTDGDVPLEERDMPINYVGIALLALLLSLIHI